jgi:hypothetical protein
MVIGDYYLDRHITSIGCFRSTLKPESS